MTCLLAKEYDKNSVSEFVRTCLVICLLMEAKNPTWPAKWKCWQGLTVKDK